MPTDEQLEQRKRVARHIRRYPEKHDQRSWGERTPCGTTTCVAGRTVLLNGWKPVWEKDFEDDDSRNFFSFCDARKGGAEEYVPTLAGKLLGLTASEEDWLFACDRTRDQILDFLDGKIKIHSAWSASYV